LFKLATPSDIWDRADCFNEDYTISLNYKGQTENIAAALATSERVARAGDTLSFGIGAAQAPLEGVIGILQPELVDGTTRQYLNLPATLEVCGYEVLSVKTAHPNYVAGASASDSKFKFLRSVVYPGVSLASSTTVAILQHLDGSVDHTYTLRDLFTSTSSWRNATATREDGVDYQALPALAKDFCKIT
jgi:hypothetical protein